jgi:hypothetical protein
VGAGRRFFARKASLVGRHRDRVALALTLGVAPKRLAGWEPVEVTDYIYDDTGRVVQTVTSREAEFDEEQVDLLLAVKQLRDDVGPHGQPMTEAIDPQGAPSVRGKKPGGYHYRASVVGTDWAADALREAQEARYADKAAAGGRDTDIWVVEKLPDRLRPRT